VVENAPFCIEIRSLQFIGCLVHVVVIGIIIYWPNFKSFFIAFNKVIFKPWVFFLSLCHNSCDYIRIILSTRMMINPESPCVFPLFQFLSQVKYLITFSSNPFNSFPFIQDLKLLLITFNIFLTQYNSLFPFFSGGSYFYSSG